MTNFVHLQYPIGKFVLPEKVDSGLVDSWIADLSALPATLIELTSGLSQDQLEVPYRPGGWTVRQVIHHLADSHINAYTRFKLTLTEDLPTIRPYYEDRWAELSDGKTGDIRLSTAILEAIHERLVTLLRTLPFSAFERRYIHPETQDTYSLAFLTGNYAWHGKHHLAHIRLTLPFGH